MHHRSSKSLTTLVVLVTLAITPFLATPAQAKTTDADLIFTLGANNVITNQLLLALSGKLIPHDPEKESANAYQMAQQVQRTMQGCHDKLLDYATERRIQNEKVITKLLSGYNVLIAQSKALILLLEKPSPQTHADYQAAAMKASELIDREFFGPQPNPQ